MGVGTGDIQAASYCYWLRYCLGRVQCNLSAGAFDSGNMETALTCCCKVGSCCMQVKQQNAMGPCESPLYNS